MVSDINGTVVGIQNNPVAEQSLSSNEDGYVLTWENSDGYWAARPIQSSGFTRIYGYQYNGSQTVSFGANTWTHLPMSSTGVFSNTSYSGNNIITNANGTVRVSAGANGVAIGGIAIYQNGSLVGVTTPAMSPSEQYAMFTVEVIVNCSIGDTFGVHLYHVGGASNLPVNYCYMTLTAC